jgi:hypothetical protein
MKLEIKSKSEKYLEEFREIGGVRGIEGLREDAEPDEGDEECDNVSYGE